jgi:hypothetical protein
VHDVGPRAAVEPAREQAARPGQRREAPVVVRPLVPALVAVRPAVAREEARAVQHARRQVGRHERPAQDARRPATKEVGVREQHAAGAERAHHRGIPGQQHVHVHAALTQREGQRAADVGQAAGLDQRVELGEDVEDAHGG